MTDFLDPTIYDDPDQLIGEPGKAIVVPQSKRGHLLSDKFSMPPEHKTMIAALKKLPDHTVPIHYWHQRQNLQEQKKMWMWVGNRIDYLQLVQFGLLPDDPCNDSRLHPAQSEHIALISSYFAAILNLLIGNHKAKVSGFALVKEAAAREKKEFSFNDPRELFAQICREFANSPIGNEIASEEPGNLTELRSNFRQQSAFYRDKLTPEAAAAILEECRRSTYWNDFWIFAVWQKRDVDVRKKGLRSFWKEFLAAHKQLTKFVCDKKDKDGVRLVIPEERPTGLHVDPKTNRVLNCKVL